MKKPSDFEVILHMIPKDTNTLEEDSSSVDDPDVAAECSSSSSIISDFLEDDRELSASSIISDFLEDDRELSASSITSDILKDDRELSGDSLCSFASYKWIKVGNALCTGSRPVSENILNMENSESDSNSDKEGKELTNASDEDSEKADVTAAKGTDRDSVSVSSSSTDDSENEGNTADTKPISIESIEQKAAVSDNDRVVSCSSTENKKFKESDTNPTRGEAKNEKDVDPESEADSDDNSSSQNDVTKKEVVVDLTKELDSDIEVIKLDDELLDSEDFSRVEMKGGLVVEDLTEDEEVWLVQCPLYLYPKNLTGKDLVFGGSGEFEVGSESYETVCVEDVKPVYLMLPSRESDDLQAKVVQPKGLLVIKQKVAVPEVEIRATSRRKSIQFPANLKTRHPLFGPDYESEIQIRTTISSSTKTRKTKDLSVHNDSSSSNEGERKRKKKSTENSSMTTEVSESDISKKKRQSEGLSRSIRTETDYENESFGIANLDTSHKEFSPSKKKKKRSSCANYTKMEANEEYDVANNTISNRGEEEDTPRKKKKKKKRESDNFKTEIIDEIVENGISETSQKGTPSKKMKRESDSCSASKKIQTEFEESTVSLEDFVISKKSSMTTEVSESDISKKKKKKKRQSEDLSRSIRTETDYENESFGIANLDTSHKEFYPSKKKKKKRSSYANYTEMEANEEYDVANNTISDRDEEEDTPRKKKKKKKRESDNFKTEIIDEIVENGISETSQKGTPSKKIKSESDSFSASNKIKTEFEESTGSLEDIVISKKSSMTTEVSESDISKKKKKKKRQSEDLSRSIRTETDYENKSFGIANLDTSHKEFYPSKKKKKKRSSCANYTEMEANEEYDVANNTISDRDEEEDTPRKKKKKKKKKRESDNFKTEIIDEIVENGISETSQKGTPSKKRKSESDSFSASNKIKTEFEESTGSLEDFVISKKKKKKDKNKSEGSMVESFNESYGEESLKKKKKKKKDKNKSEGSMMESFNESYGEESLKKKKKKKKEQKEKEVQR